MKVKIFLLFCALFCLAQQPSYGAFRISHTSNTRVVSKSKAVVSSHASGSWLSKRMDRLHGIPHPDPRKDILGRLSLVFGICGFIPVVGWLFAITAIILGALGIRKKQKLSRAGMILGICALVIGIIVAIIIISSLSLA